LGVGVVRFQHLELRKELLAKLLDVEAGKVNRFHLFSDPSRGLRES
jgi:hypothetical protein